MFGIASENRYRQGESQPPDQSQRREDIKTTRADNVTGHKSNEF